MLVAVTGLAAAAWALHVTGASPTDAGSPAAPVPHTTLQDFPKVPYDGTYTFVRVRFNTRGGRGGRGFGRGGGPGWAHDYPYADDNFIKILDEVTLLGPNTEGTNIVNADDPELHRYPIAYVSEPGQWSPTQAEVDNLAAYLRKGGFLILDDFRSNYEWSNVEAIFNAILPGTASACSSSRSPSSTRSSRSRPLSFRRPHSRSTCPGSSVSTRTTTRPAA